MLTLSLSGVIVLAGVFGAWYSCGTASRGNTVSSAKAAVNTGSDASARQDQRNPTVPPDPQQSPAANAPAQESALLSNPAYIGIWAPENRGDIDIVLSAISEMLETATTEGTSTISVENHDAIAGRHRLDVVLNIFDVFSSAGRATDDFSKHTLAYLDSIKSRPHQGVWYQDRKPPIDFSALATWVMRDDPVYMREFLAAKSRGPIKWRGIPAGKAPAYPYLTSEKEALHRLSLLGELVPEETARMEALQRPVHLVDEIVPLGDFAYRILPNLEFFSVLGNALVSETPNPGAVFLVVHYYVTNNSNDTKTVRADNFEIVDRQRRRFRSSTRASTAYAMSGRRKELLLMELQPGIETAATQVFELPKEILADGIELYIPETGFAKGGARVTLPRFAIE
jgi:hypothetical protein